MNPDLEWERFVFSKGNSTIEVIRERVLEDPDRDDDFFDFDMFN